MTAYVVGEVDIKDTEAFAAYRKLGVPSIEQHGGRVLARSDEALALEGDWHPRRWHTSPEYQAARQLRLYAGVVRSVAFEGA